MTPPSVLLDLGFLQALLRQGGGDAERARECYAVLVRRYRDHQRRLRARHDHLADAVASRAGDDLRRTLLAPVEAVHVAAQHRRQARRLVLPAEVAGDDDLAVTLVVMRRERISEVASFDPAFDALDVTRHC